MPELVVLRKVNLLLVCVTRYWLEVVFSPLLQPVRSCEWITGFWRSKFRIRCFEMVRIQVVGQWFSIGAWFDEFGLGWILG